MHIYKTGGHVEEYKMGETMLDRTTKKKFRATFNAVKIRSEQCVMAASNVNQIPTFIKG